MKLSILIPNYNGEEILAKNLPKVLEAISGVKYESEIIISDDFSKDNSIEVIKKFISDNEKSNTKISLITASKNKGFSSNVNKAAKEAKGEIFILLNTDVIPSKNFLEYSLPHFEDQSVFAVGCLDESIEGNKVVPRGRGKGFWKRGVLIHSAADLDGKNTLWVSGGSGLFRKEIWEKLGGLDELFDPFYWEDIDLSYRGRKSGYKTIFEKKSVVRHEHEKGAIKTKYKSNQVKKIAYRNQFIFAWKNSDTRNLLTNIFWLPYFLIKALISGDFVMILGFFQAIIRLPKILSARRRTQRLFVVSDNEATRLD